MHILKHKQHTERKHEMSISENIASKTGKITGKTANFIKRAPDKTASKTKAIKNAFVEGVKSTKPKRSENFDKIFE